MSQMVTRKGGVTDEKEKRQTDSPQKEMKKKMAANAEKEKQTSEKQAEKSTDKSADKSTEKTVEKPTADKKIDSKTVEKKTENKPAEKKDAQTDKPKDDVGEKSGKSDKQQDANEKTKKTEPSKDKKPAAKDATKPAAKDSPAKPVAKDSPAKPVAKDSPKPAAKDTPTKPVCKDSPRPVHNGVTDVTLNTTNGGSEDVLNGAVSEDDDDVMLIIDDQDQDELFPELTYDDGSDVECFEPPTPESAPSRSLTRRSQSKEPKVLKLKEDIPSTDRRLRSADSPKPQDKKPSDKTQESPKKPQESPKKPQDATKSAEDGQESSQKDDKEIREEKEKENGGIEMDVVVEIEDNQEENRKLDTNYSKSRVKVSPYRRSMRIADQTTSSVMANYSGNNTTMEMDITETSSFINEDASLNDSSYLSGLRGIRGRRSYKPLKEMTLRHVTVLDRSLRTATTTGGGAVTEPSSRPTGTVVGRKRKPEAGDIDIELASEVREAAGKRPRLFERIARPFRRAPPAEIVGINTDLPLTAPVVAADTFDPETLKTGSVVAPTVTVTPPTPTPAHEMTSTERDSKRCVVM